MNTCNAPICVQTVTRFSNREIEEKVGRQELLAGESARHIDRPGCLPHLACVWAGLSTSPVYAFCRWLDRVVPWLGDCLHHHAVVFWLRADGTDSGVEICRSSTIRHLGLKGNKRVDPLLKC
ncbi:unnamed protein product [Hapterophycus canaliculatus]